MSLSWVFFNLSVFRFQVYSLQSIDSNIYLFCFMYFQINSKRVSIGSFFPLFLGQLTVPHDVISSSGVGDSALPGHPVRVGGSGAGNNFEMSPLLSHEQMKDSIITLDYVSIKLFQLKSFKIERQKLSKLKKLANQPPLEAFVQPSGEVEK